LKELTTGTIQSLIDGTQGTIDQLEVLGLHPALASAVSSDDSSKPTIDLQAKAA
jgi:hypothetical protein